MANSEHVRILKRGAAQWNEWRKAYPDEEIDLVGADLRGLDLTVAEPSSPEYRQANKFMRPLLRARVFGDPGVDLHGAKLMGARLKEACLVSANFAEADLSGAQLTGADCRRAWFGGANLTSAKASGPN